MASCSKCEMLQPLQKCQENISARLYLEHGENYLSLSAFDDVLRDIACSSDVTPSKAKPFNIIASVEM